MRWVGEYKAKVSALKNAALLRQEIECVMKAHMTGALTPAPRYEHTRIRTGIRPIDDLLQGGLAEGVITELVGNECSGRTTMALACLAAVTQSGSVCAWIDAADSLEPENTAASGVDLERLLWVRCGAGVKHNEVKVNENLLSPYEKRKQIHPDQDLSIHSVSIAGQAHEAGGSLVKPSGSVYGNQARREKRRIGTPGHPNRHIINRSEERVEQTNWDRLPPRRGDNLNLSPRCVEPHIRRPACIGTQTPLVGRSQPALANVTSSKPWEPLDQALRSVDLLLQSGGFGAIVLDLASIPAKVVWRIPMATWFRFRSACESTRISLILLTQHACARSSAEIVVRLHPGTLQAENRSMTGVLYRGDAERGRRQHAEEDQVVSIRKPPQPVRSGEWKSELLWK